MNIYFTTESVEKLQSVIMNVRSFYIFDVKKFIADMNINPNKPANVYFINNEIVNTISAAAKLKKYHGIIYINDNLSESLYKSMKAKFGTNDNIDKFVLIDNGNVNKLKRLHNIFDEVIFFDRFRKIKIIECNPTVTGNLVDFSPTMLGDSYPYLDF